MKRLKTLALKSIKTRYQLCGETQLLQRRQKYRLEQECLLEETQDASSAPKVYPLVDS